MILNNYIYPSSYFELMLFTKESQNCKINQVWQTDITYIPLNRGFMYMIAIIDVFS